MAQLLTHKKQRWVNQFKPNVLRGGALNPNISDAIKYQERLYKLINAMFAETEKKLRKLFSAEYAEEFFAQDASVSSQARILTNALAKKYNNIFASVAKPIAEQVTSEANKSSTTALHMSLKDLSGGLSLKTSSLTPDLLEILNATVTENVGLIKSISTKYLEGVQGAVMRSITTGNGLQELVPYLQKSKEITYRRAQLIALDQTRKAFNNLSKGKMENLGIKEFEWLHSGGSTHPRKLHQQLSGKIFPLAEPPVIEDNKGKQIRGFPGQLPYCRCRILPVIKFNEN